MNLFGVTREDVDRALAACNAGFYDGQLAFLQTNAKDARYISGVLRHTNGSAPGARRLPPTRRSPNGRRSRFADWQGHYDFMEQLLLLRPDATITSRWHGPVEYKGLLGFYHLAGQVKSARVQYMGVQSTMGEQVGNGRT